MSLRSIVSTALIVAAGVSASAQTQRNSPDGMPTRDAWQRVSDIVAALGSIDGKRVADVAAGTGYLTAPLARAVGAKGRVYAEEIGDAELRALHKFADENSLKTVEVIAGSATDPHLPASLDAAVVLNSYHEFEDYRAMLDGIKRSLRPGGTLVLVDNGPLEPEKPRAYQVQHHTLDPRFVDAELRAAGFEIVDRQDHFIDGPFPIQQWMFVARRPK